MNLLYTTDPGYREAVDKGSVAIMTVYKKSPRKFQGAVLLDALVRGILLQVQSQQKDWFNSLSHDDQRTLPDDLIAACHALIYGRALQ